MNYYKKRKLTVAIVEMKQNLDNKHVYCMGAPLNIYFISIKLYKRVVDSHEDRRIALGCLNELSKTMYLSPTLGTYSTFYC